MAYNHLLVPVTSAPQPTEKQLKQTLKNTKYLHPSGAAKQIFGSLDDFRDLKPSIREYESGGRKIDLMQLSGTLPVNVVEKQFEIPVRLWLPKSFPKERPVVQVHPSPDMALTTVNYVDGDGKVTLPYLTDWKESRSDLSTLIKMLKFKFSQTCPVYQVRVASFSFGTTTRLQSPSPNGTRTTRTRHSMSDFLDEVDPPELNSSEREKEILSYRKTIDALTMELDGLGSRVRELEQAKQESQIILEEARNINRIMLEQASQGGMLFGRDSLYSSGISNGSAQQQGEEERQLELETAEKERYQQLLEEEKEKLQKEVKEKEKIKSRLDSKVSDLTQTRERIAILEVEKDDYMQKLHRTVKELKHSKVEVRELTSLKRTLKAKASTLEMEVRDLQGSGEASAEVCELKEKVKSSELELEELSSSLKGLETDKQQLTTQLNQSLEAEEELFEERKELRMKLDAALQFSAATEEQCNQGSEIPTLVPPSLVDTETQTSSLSCMDSQTQVGCSEELAEKSVQVDTLTDMCAQYRLSSEESGNEVLGLREEIRRINTAFQTKSKDAVTKIRQLLDIKEQLTKKNDDLRRELEEAKPPAAENYEVTLKSALHNIQELQQNLLGRSSEDKSTSDQLQNALAEMEEMKQSHLHEKLAMRQRVSDVIAKVKERETQHTEEMNDLKAKLEKAQKQTQEASDMATKSVEGANIPSSSLVSFMEVEAITPHKLDAGTWGYTVEAIFRGTRVAVRCVTKESLARYPIQMIHKQIHAMVHTHHPNLALFIAAAMDAPNGMMILTELHTCSLRQAYQSDLIKPDKLPVLLDVALALNFLHLEKRFIVHNNLSSHCVLVEEGAEGQWRAKLSDIGLTTPLMMLSGPEERDPIYVPPELKTKSCSLISPSLDVYSYGMLMCELANSKVPDSVAEAVAMVSGLRDRQLPQIACLVQCCTIGDPGQRPAMSNMVKKINHLIVNKIQVP